MQNKETRKAYFLATTALEEFWDIKMPILFIDEWCKKYGRKSFWETLNYKTVRSSWYDKEHVYRARQYTREIFNKMINLLSERLNYIHHESHSVMYWKIILGAWLRWYINIIYTRYTNLIDVIDNYEDFTTILLSPQCYVVPKDTLDFMKLARTDEYNLQIFSRIFQALNMKFPIRSLETKNIRICGNDQININTIIEKNYHKALRNLFHLFQNRGVIFLVNSHFKILDTLRILYRTSGKVYPIIKKKTPLLSLNISQDKRLALKAINPSNSEFEILLDRLLPFDLPICFIEEYETIKKFTANYYPKRPRVIFSATGWYFEEEFKQWAAISKEKGVTLIGTQHGGNYGSILDTFEEEFETEITDRYYTWGWEKKNCRAQVIPFYGSKLIGNKKNGPSNSKKGILFISTQICRYPFYICRYSYIIDKYLSWQQIFINKVDSKIKPMMKIRLHKLDYDFEMHERWKDFAPDLLVEGFDVPFLSRLRDCRLIVCDHLSTTFAEALSSNKPSILFWDRESYTLKNEAVPYYNMLNDVGILYYSPEEAAEKVNLVYSDVEKWWNRSDLQSALKIFTDKYARSINNGNIEWTKEFLKIIDSHNRSLDDGR